MQTSTRMISQPIERSDVQYRLHNRSVLGSTSHLWRQTKVLAPAQHLNLANLSDSNPVAAIHVLRAAKWSSEHVSWSFLCMFEVFSHVLSSSITFIVPIVLYAYTLNHFSWVLSVYIIVKFYKSLSQMGKQGLWQTMILNITKVTLDTGCTTKLWSLVQYLSGPSDPTD